MPGFGHADTREEYWPKQGVLSHVEFIKDFMDALCIDKAHISGNSMGCINSVQFAQAYPDRVLSFALIAGFIGDLVGPEKYVPISEGKFTPNPNYVRPDWDGTEESMRVLMEGIIYKEGVIWPELIKMRNDAAIRQRESHDALQAAREQTAKDPNLAQKLSTKNRFNRLTIPGIYLYGKQDVLIPWRTAGIRRTWGSRTSSSSTPTSADTRASPTSRRCSTRRSSSSSSTAR